MGLNAATESKMRSSLTKTNMNNKKKVNKLTNSIAIQFILIRYDYLARHCFANFQIRSFCSAATKRSWLALLLTRPPFSAVAWTLPLCCRSLWEEEEKHLLPLLLRAWSSLTRTTTGHSSSSSRKAAMLPAALATLMLRW